MGIFTGIGIFDPAIYDPKIYDELILKPKNLYDDDYESFWGMVRPNIVKKIIYQEQYILLNNQRNRAMTLLLLSLANEI
jgi:hypothetical protein